MSVNAPQRPFCASIEPMKVNFKLLMIVSASTLMLLPPPAGNVVVPPMSGR